MEPGDEAVALFCEATGAQPWQAFEYLDSTTSLDQAVELWYSAPPDAPGTVHTRRESDDQPMMQRSRSDAAMSENPAHPAVQPGSRPIDLTNGDEDEMQAALAASAGDHSMHLITHHIMGLLSPLHCSWPSALLVLSLLHALRLLTAFMFNCPTYAQLWPLALAQHARLPDQCQ